MRERGNQRAGRRGTEGSEEKTGQMADYTTSRDVEQIFRLVSSDQMHMFVEEYGYSFFPHNTFCQHNTRPLFLHILFYYIRGKKKDFFFPESVSTFGKCASVLDIPCIFCVVYDCRESGISSVSPSPRTQLCSGPGVWRTF